LEGTATWWRLEDRFALHGKALRLLGDDPDVLVDSNGMVIPVAVHGPFSNDFVWVYLQGWPHGPIRLTEAQSKLFAVLWEHRHQAESAEFLMRRAGLASDKPMDVFKVKVVNQGDPKYEGPLLAYEKLVLCQRRHGLYRLASPST
jgi:hypothetical protein